MFDLGNAYEVELREDIDISPIFDIADLYEYHKEYFGKINRSDFEQKYPKRKIYIHLRRRIH